MEMVIYINLEPQTEHSDLLYWPEQRKEASNFVRMHISIQFVSISGLTIYIMDQLCRLMFK